MNRRFTQETQALFARGMADAVSAASDGSGYALSPVAISLCTEFFNRVLPSAGLRCAMRKEGNHVDHKFFRTNDELARYVLQEGQLTDTYHCTASLKSNRRKGENVAHRRVLRTVGENFEARASILSRPWCLQQSDR